MKDHHKYLDSKEIGRYEDNVIIITILKHAKHHKSKWNFYRDHYLNARFFSMINMCYDDWIYRMLWEEDEMATTYDPEFGIKVFIKNDEIIHFSII